MNDRDLEESLLKYQPAEPAVDLIRQITHATDRLPAKPIWPWAIAAAALLAVTVVLHGMSFAGSPDDSHAALQREIADVTAALGGDPLDRAVAVLIVQRERARAEEQR
jgi:hypothetical protein